MALAVLPQLLLLLVRSHWRGQLSGEHVQGTLRNLRLRFQVLLLQQLGLLQDSWNIRGLSCVFLGAAVVNVAKVDLLVLSDLFLRLNLTPLQRVHLLIRICIRLQHTGGRPNQLLLVKTGFGVVPLLDGSFLGIGEQHRLRYLLHNVADALVLALVDRVAFLHVVREGPLGYRALLLRLLLLINQLLLHLLLLNLSYARGPVASLVLLFLLRH